MRDDSTNENLSRIAVVGTSGCGKSTFAQNLSIALGVPHIELDSLYWGPNWTPIPADQFQSKADIETSRPSWVCDGNYAPVRTMIWKRATTVIWLNYSLPVVFGRTLRRSLWRAWSGEELFAGNRESFRITFLSRESILLWVLRTHAERRREFAQLRKESQFSHLNWIEFQHPAEADQWLDTVCGKSRQTSAAYALRDTHA
jgi:adenylate kinase family enzyme